MKSPILITVITSLAITNLMAQIDKDAGIAVDNYLKALQILDLSEGKELLQKSSWPDWGTTPVLLKADTVFEAMFDTDCPGVRGYKRLVSCEVQSEAKTKLFDKYVVIAYPDHQTKQWKVLCFARPANFDDAAIADGRKNLGNTQYGSDAFNYRRMAYSYSGAGKLRLARDAYKKAADINRSAPDKTIKQQEFDMMVDGLKRIIPE